MQVKFKMNLGSVDAAKLGLDYTACQCGMTCDVCDDVGEKLVSGNIATAVPAKAIHAVPDKAEIADAKTPEIKGVQDVQPSTPSGPVEQKPEATPIQAKPSAKTTTKPTAKK